MCNSGLTVRQTGRVREEVNQVAGKYHSDNSAPLKERLMSVPLEAWDFEFPDIDLCLREVIRLQLSGTSFRKNTGPDIPLNAVSVISQFHTTQSVHGQALKADMLSYQDGTEVIPRDTFVTYSTADVHYNPEIYSEVLTWDPSRFLPDRAEDKKQMYGFVGWGTLASVHHRHWRLC